MATPAGYATTPLAKKLGIVAGVRVCVLGAPRDYRALLAPWPEGAVLAGRVDRSTDIVHLFTDARAVLAREASRLRGEMRDDAVLWVSWPKKASKRPTDIGEDDVREVVLPLGWVDVKVCAVDAVWSGLKLCVRRELRG